MIMSRCVREAEPVYQRSLATMKQDLGPEYPDLSVKPENDASQLRQTHRTARQAFGCRCLFARGGLSAKNALVLEPGIAVLDHGLERHRPIAELPLGER